AACHTIGAKEGAKPGKQPIGPDLHGVTRKRDRAWLVRWLAEPDKMLAEKDPLASALLAEYGNVPMPNLRLGVDEIKALLTYIDEESMRQPLP
ncbi:MAG: cytochrome c, partial [Deltaproteobacteria bacterium]|nr:cytochrome c [Deltaproteobacteria bacterium]